MNGQTYCVNYPTHEEFLSASSETAATEPAFPCSALTNLPDPNPFFTGREDLLSHIAPGLKKMSTVIFSGPDGFGKTQIALEYAHRHVKEYEYIWRFNAESELYLQEGYREFARRVVGLSTAGTEEFEIVRLHIDNWLIKNTSYLFIYDDADLFLDTKTEECPDWQLYLPHNQQRGHILICARERLQNIIGEQLNVTVFDIADAATFLEKRLASANKAAAVKLSQALGYLPLALEQAAAYINEYHCTIEQYSYLFRKTGLYVLNKPSLNTDRHKIIITTWIIALEKLTEGEDNKAAVQLINLLAYCAAHDIPLQMFIDGCDELPPLLRAALESGDTPEHDELLGKLRRCSLISVRHDDMGKTFLSIHRLLQAAVAHNLDSNTEYLLYCLKMAIKVFDFEYTTPEDFDSFAVDIPHMLEIASHAEAELNNNSEALIKVAHVYLEAGRGLCEKGDFTMALKCYKKALIIHENVLGEEHPHTATTCNNIALVYRCQGDYVTALEWLKKVQAICEKTLGAEHPQTAATYNNTALVYRYQGDYDTALEWLGKVLVIREKVLGAEHPHTAATYNNIALAYEGLGDCATALEWHLKALAIREKVLGAEHPHTVETYNNIALAYDGLGDYTSALEWYKKVLTIREKVLGMEHPDIAATYNNIAGVYHDLGDCATAMGWLKKVWAIREKVLGAEHPYTATTYNNIAGVYYHQGDYTTALEWYKKAYRILRKNYGESHPNTKTVFCNAEDAYNAAGFNEDFTAWLAG